MSGTLMDAFSNYKPIIVTSSPLSKACQNVYPSIIKDYDVDSFLKSIMEFRERTDIMKNEFDRFISFHDDSNLTNIIENTIDNSLNGKIQNNKTIIIVALTLVLIIAFFPFFVALSIFTALF